LLLREVSAPLDTLRILSSATSTSPPYLPYSPKYDEDEEEYYSTDVDMWIRDAIKV
jgi:hypothetical protein